MLGTSPVQLAREIGLEATSEPPTTNLLLNEFTDEQCRLMFPKNPNKATNKTAGEANQLVLRIRDCKKDRDAAGARRAKTGLTACALNSATRPRGDGLTSSSPTMQTEPPSPATSLESTQLPRPSAPTPQAS
jgi:hypothetical protein